MAIKKTKEAKGIYANLSEDWQVQFNRLCIARNISKKRMLEEMIALYEAFGVENAVAATRWAKMTDARGWRFRAKIEEEMERLLREQTEKPEAEKQP